MYKLEARDLQLLRLHLVTFRWYVLLNAGLTTTSNYADRSEKSFHTDNCEVMAFFYIESASSGGQTILSSMWQTYNELAANRPDVLHTLAKPWVFDR
jgi:hypothetical protein